MTIDRTTGRLAANQGFSNQVATRAQLYAAPFDALAFNGVQVNGGMEVSQENGTSSVTLTATSSLQTKYLVDGVMAAYRGTFVAAGQQVTDAPPGYRNSLKFTVSTAQASLGSNDELSVLIPIEGVRASRLALGTASAAAISIGFWVKVHRTGSYSGSLRNSAKNRSYPFSFMVSAADTWEFKTVTFGGDTGSTWLSDTGVGLYLSICIAGGASRLGAVAAWAGSDTSGVTGTTNAVAANSDTFQITGLIVLPGIELPASDRAPLIMRPFDQELITAKRYWQFAGGAVANLFASGLLNAAFMFAPSMRASPTPILVNGTGAIDLPGAATYNATAINANFGPSPTSSLVQVAHSGTGTGVGEVYPEKLAFSARL